MAGVFAEGDAVDDECPTEEVDELAAMPDAAAGAQTGDPSSALLSGLPLSGYVLAPPGPQNGPVIQSIVDLFGASSGPVTQALARTDVSTAVRVWTQTPANGTTILASAFQFANTSAAGAFRSRVARTQRGSKFPVTFLGHEEAFGRETAASVNGTPTETYLVCFSIAKSTAVIVVIMVATTPAFTIADASLVANKQWAAAAAYYSPGGVISIPLPGRVSTSSVVKKVAEVAGVVLVIVLILGITVALTRRQNTQVWRAPAEVSGPLEAGWYPAPEGAGQAYWDGQAWTRRRFWTGTGWTEFSGS